MTGLQVGKALRCSGDFDFESAVPGHPTSICDKGINNGAIIWFFF